MEGSNNINEVNKNFVRTKILAKLNEMFPNGKDSSGINSFTFEKKEGLVVANVNIWYKKYFGGVSGSQNIEKSYQMTFDLNTDECIAEEVNNNNA